MISPETYELLSWIKANAGEGLHPYQMEEMGAPFATDSSIEELRRCGYLRRVYGGYVVSIDGAAALCDYDRDKSIDRSIQRLAKAQENIHAEMQAEEIARSKDDKKYFMWGMATSAFISIAVEYGAELIALFQALLQP